MIAINTFFCFLSSHQSDARSNLKAGSNFEKACLDHAVKNLSLTTIWSLIEIRMINKVRIKIVHAQ